MQWAWGSRVKSVRKSEGSRELARLLTLLLAVMVRLKHGTAKPVVRANAVSKSWDVMGWLRVVLDNWLESANQLGRGVTS